MNRFLSSTLFCFFVSSAVTAEDWNQWRGPRRDGSVAQTTWPDQLTDRLTKRWEMTLQPSYSGPVMQDGVVFTTETIDEKVERVTAYSIEDGSKVWQHEWPGSMTVPFFAATNGSWIRSTPAVVPGYLVVLGMRDVLVCMDPKNGGEKWRIDFPADLDKPLEAFGGVCSPLIHEGAVYVQLGGGLTKVILETGEVAWQVLDSQAGMSGGAFSSPSLATIHGKPQLLVQTRTELCGVDLESGQTLWTEPIEAFRGMNILTPLAIGGRVFTAAHSGRSQLFDIRRDDASWSVDEAWRQKTQGYMSSPVKVDDAIYLHLKNERFTCLDAEDGTIHWTSPPVGKYWSMVHNGENILALASDGVLRLIEATPEEYRVLDQTKVADDSWAYLAVDGKTIVVRDLNSLQVYQWN